LQQTADNVPESEATPSGTIHSVLPALVDVVEAGQRVLLDRIELLRLDFRQAVDRGINAGIVFACGAVLLVAAWLASMAALVLYLNRWITPEASLAAVALATAVVGAGLTGLAHGRNR
jgi:hypothetical protein